MPNDDKTVDILAGAKKALSSGSSFTKSVEGKTNSSFAPKPASKPAPAAPAKPKSQTDKDVSDIAGGLKWRGEQAKAVNTLGSFKHGGTVPKTGAYQLHKDEQVIPAEKAKQMDTKVMDAASQALGKSSPSKPTMKAKLHMRITPTDNGAYIMDHEHRGGSEGESKPPAQHVAMDVKSLLKHVGDHYGAKASDWEQERSDAPASPKGKEVEAAGADKKEKAPKDDKKD